MDWILLAISTTCFVCLFIHFGIFSRAEKLFKNFYKVSEIIRSNHISDHWKEKVLPHYSLQLFTQSLIIFTLLLISFSPFAFCLLISILINSQFAMLASSLKGMAVSSCLAIFLAMLLSVKPKKKDYSVTSRVLHQIILGNSLLGEVLFDIEKFFFGSNTSNISAGKHVFIAGLARSGTTILMRTLYKYGEFCSLTYNDMPFILAPNTWRAVSKFSKQKREKKERAHGDGLKVDYDSPEAFEEVFWRTFCGSEYIKKDHLIPMTANNETIIKFRSFISIVLKNKSNKSYLSKNNNNILRLKTIYRSFPEALILIPFREPLQHAFSLRNTNEPFTKKYMTWLSHHEFGPDHRPFIFDKKINNKEDKEKLNYWLKFWIRTYSYILENPPPQAIFISYERLCNDTKNIWEKLSERIDLEPYNDKILFSESINIINEPLPDKLKLEATKLYTKLTNIAL